MTHLQQRADAFLKRSIPAELKPHYVPDSMTDQLLAYYVVHGSLDDPESLELLEICAMEAEAAADRQKTQESKAFFRDCADILQSILAEAV